MTKDVQEEIKSAACLHLTPEEVSQILAVMSFAIDENFYGHEDVDLFNAEDKKFFFSACDKLKEYAEKIGVGGI